MSHCLVFDIGKTHVKWHVVDAKQKTIALKEIENEVSHEGEYPHVNVDMLWQAFIDTVQGFKMRASIKRLCVATHGATAALIDRDILFNEDCKSKNKNTDGLVLPIMDYEFSGIETVNDEYNLLRPNEKVTGNPSLSAGLNLGRQFFWQQKNFPDRFQTATDILLYPQYWTWRLTGKRFSEVTSLACHTDLWAPWENTFSPLVHEQGWLEKFPPLASAWEVAGRIDSDVAKQSGISPNCEVFVGVHDSNASYLLYKRAMVEAPFSVVSTGTWSIVMDANAERDVLQVEKDMLVNMDVGAKPVMCSRFMGGREFSDICYQLENEIAGFENISKKNYSFPESYRKYNYTVQDLKKILAAKVFCLPSWQKGAGPFGNQRGRIVGELNNDIVPAALASLYCALMLDYQLDLVESRGNVIITGAFLKNKNLVQLLAQLRAPQAVHTSSGLNATVMGAEKLTRWDQEDAPMKLNRVDASEFNSLVDYKKLWRQLCLNDRLTDS
ncbi:FGGY-family carbohydrate kinase [Aurantivibrio infirmus]